MKIYLTFTFIFFIQTILLAQKSVEISTYLSSSGKTPFCQKTNQYGIVPIQSPFISARGLYKKDYDSTLNENNKLLKKLDWGYGSHAVLNIGKKSQFLIPEIYLKARMGIFELYAGRKKEIIGLTDSTLGLGSIIWSGNALPIPKLQIHTPNYFSIIGKGLISIKLGYSHGWFGNQNFAKGYYLHQKWLYGKIGRDSWKINLFGGVNHNAQWGGYSEILKNDNFSTINGHFSDDFFVYKNVVIPLPIWQFPTNHQYTPYETLNRFGNHLGSVDIGLTIKSTLLNISLFRQTPFEDGQMPEVFLSADGNYSLNLDLKNSKSIKKIYLGYLDTRRQGLEITRFAQWLGKKETHPNEYQSYFQHGQYRDGWSYNDFSIGTPFIFDNKDLLNPSENHQGFTINNTLQAFSFSLLGLYRKTQFKFINSYTINYGFVVDKWIKPIKQYSSLLEVLHPFKNNYMFKAAIGIDNGNLYGKNLGLNISVLKNW